MRACLFAWWIAILKFFSSSFFFPYWLRLYWCSRNNHGNSFNDKAKNADAILTFLRRIWGECITSGTRSSYLENQQKSFLQVKIQTFLDRNKGISDITNKSLCFTPDFQHSFLLTFREETSNQPYSSWYKWINSDCPDPKRPCLSVPPSCSTAPAMITHDIINKSLNKEIWRRVNNLFEED